MSYVVINGDYVTAEEARVPVDDRGLLLGDGLFETMRSYNGTVFRLEDHLTRLFNSCRALNINLSWSRDELFAMIAGLMEKNDAPDARVRLTVTRGAHKGGMNLAPQEAPTLIITAEPMPEGLGREAAGVSLAVSDVRFSENNPLFRHKTLNRLPHLWARQQAADAGADEALVLDERGNAATCTTGNVFLVQHDQLFTPPLTGPVLPGVTRKAVLEIAMAEGVGARQDFFSPLVFASAEEAFMTNSVREIVPVLSVDGRPVGSGGPGPLTVRFQKLYAELVQRQESSP